MTYEFYKILHIFGLLLAFTGLIGVFMAKWNTPELKNSVRFLGAISHGIGLLFLFVSGFGLAAKLGYFGSLPGWVYTKIALWLVVGLLMYFAKRKPNLGWGLYSVILATGFIAILLAVTKPY